MKFVRITDAQGETLRVVSVRRTKRTVLAAASKEGRLRCAGTCCQARVLFVSGPALRSTVRAAGVHGAQCENREDAHTPDHTRTFEDALESGLPILMTLAFDTGAEELRPRFQREAGQVDAAAMEEIGVWTKQRWLQVKGAGGHEVFSSSDLVSLLHYLRTAKAAGRLQQLWFNTDGIVQSYDHFALINDSEKIQKTVTEVLDRMERTKSTVTPFVMTLTHLLIFQPGEDRVKRPPIPVQPEPEDWDMYSKRYREKLPEVFGQVSVIRNPTWRPIQLGLQMNENSLVKSRALLTKEAVWVIANMSMFRSHGDEIIAVGRRKLKDKPKDPALLMAHVRDARQIAAIPHAV